MKLFNRDGRLVYSDDRTIIGGRAFAGDTAQGFHVSHPLPADELGEWLEGQAVSVSLRGPARNPSSSSGDS